jgi:hypothetical protein
MSGLKDLIFLIFFIVGLLLIILGFVSFVLLTASSQLGINVGNNLLFGLGILLIFIGSTFMFLFYITEDKKKRNPLNK